MSNVILSIGQRLGHRLQLLTSISGQRVSFSSISKSLPNQGSTKLNALNPVTSSVILNQSSIRGIFDSESLGLDKLDRLRDSFKNNLERSGEDKDQYMTRIKKLIEAGDNKSVFIEDLIKLLALAETDQDIESMEKLVQMISSGGESVPSSGWDTDVMRLYFKLGKVDRAYDIFMSPDCGHFFKKLATIKILMTMLYNAQRYEDVLRVNDMAPKRLGELKPDLKDKYDVFASLLVLGSLAKINTPDALEKSKGYIDDIMRSKAFSLKKTSFVAYLAINNDQPNFAVNLISNMQGRNYITLSDLKLLALAKMNRFEEVLVSLNSIAQKVGPGKSYVLKDTYETLKNLLETSSDPPVKEELNDTLDRFSRDNNVGEETLEEVMFRSIIALNRNRNRNSQRRNLNDDRNQMQEDGPRRWLRHSRDQRDSSNFEKRGDYNSGDGFRDNRRFGRDNSGSTTKRSYDFLADLKA